MSIERRVFERERVKIPFIYSLDEGDSLFEGEWFQAITEDMGPVLVGGLAFHCDRPHEPGARVRVALFMDLSLQKLWREEDHASPPIYHGIICRVTPQDGCYHTAIHFQGLEGIRKE